MSITFRKPKIEPIEVNLTPMIDCLLFLVIFLMLSTTFSKYSRINLMLPEATGVPTAKHLRKIEVAIDAKGQYVINGNSIGLAEEAELTAAMRQAIGNQGTVPLVVAADGKTSHQSVVRVMDVAGKLGLVNINISTRLPKGERSE